VALVDEHSFDPGNATVLQIMKKYDELAGIFC